MVSSYIPATGGDTVAPQLESDQTPEVSGIGWWMAGAAVGALAWALVRRRVQATIVERRAGHDLPAWVPMIGALTSVGLCAAVFGLTERRVEIVGIAGFAIAMVTLGVIDAATLTLPRQIVWATAGWGAVALAPIAFADHDPGRLVRAAVGAVVAAAAVWVIRALTHGGVGFGDVRLAVPLGLFCGWRSWAALGRAGLVAVVVNAVVALALVATRRVGRRTKLPFGPSLVAGALWALLVR